MAWMARAITSIGRTFCHPFGIRLFGQCWRLPVLGQDGDQLPARGADRQRTAEHLWEDCHRPAEDVAAIGG